MSPEELDQCIEGYNRAERRKWYRAAWMVAHLLAPHKRRGARAITPEKLLGLPPAKKPRAK